MRHVMILSSEFAPLPTVGRLRVQRFCRELRDHGWRVTLLTLAPPRGHRTDPALLAEIPDEIELHRVGCPQPFDWPFRVAAWRRGRSNPPNRESADGRHGRVSDDASPTHTTWLARASAVLGGFKGRLNRHLLIPDDTVTAVPALIRLGRKIVIEQRVGLMLVSVPSFSFWLAAEGIRRVTSCPLVVDYRDLWNGDVLRQWMGPFRTRFEKYLEDRLLAQVSGVMTVTRRKTETLRPRLADGVPTLSLYNAGPRLPASVALDAPAQRPLNITYTGRLYGTRRADPLIRACVDVIRQGRISPGDLRLRIIGDVSSDQQQRLRSLLPAGGHTSWLTLEPSVTYAEASQAQASADVLLVIVDQGPTSAGVVPAKLVEYFQKQRFVLALTGAGEVADLIERYRFGVAVNPASPTAIEDVLTDLVQRFRSHPAWFRTHPCPESNPLITDGGVEVDAFCRRIVGQTKTSHRTQVEKPAPELAVGFLGLRGTDR